MRNNIMVNTIKKIDNEDVRFYQFNEIEIEIPKNQDEAWLSFCDRRMGYVCTRISRVRAASVIKKMRAGQKRDWNMW